MGGIVRYRMETLREELRGMSEYGASQEGLRLNAYYFRKVIRKDPDISQVEKLTQRLRAIIRDKAVGLFEELLYEGVYEQLTYKLVLSGMQEHDVARLKMRTGKSWAEIDYSTLSRKGKEIAKQSLSTEFVSKVYLDIYKQILDEVNEFASAITIERTYKLLWVSDMQEPLGTFEKFKENFACEINEGRLTFVVDFERFPTPDKQRAIEMLLLASEQVEREIIKQFERLMISGEGTFSN